MAQEENIQYVLPTERPDGWTCAKEFVEGKEHLRCGCPNCLRKDGLTLVYNAEDWNPEDDLRSHWRKRLVSLKTGRMAPHLIIPHFPGYDPGPAVMKYPDDMPGRYPGDPGSDDPA